MNPKTLYLEQSRPAYLVGLAVRQRRGEMPPAYLTPRAQLLDLRRRRQLPHCELRGQLQRCNGLALEVHHRLGRAPLHGHDMLNEAGAFMGVCRSCHHYIERHPAEAYEFGWSIPRNRVSSELLEQFLRDGFPPVHPYDCLWVGELW